MKTILIVDDLDTFRDSVRVILRKFGFQALSAKNGQEAFTMLEAETPDLILLDLSMPVMDGFTFLKQLRERDAWKAIPVILLTGRADRDKMELAAKLGVADYLVKASFSLTVLMKKIEQVLQTDLESMNPNAAKLLAQADSNPPSAKDTAPKDKS